MPSTEARIDKWLWAARLYKTRTLAADACKNGRIRINGVIAKPSRTVKAGDTVEVRKSPVDFRFRVLQPVENRVGAKFVPDVREDCTPAEQLELLRIARVGAYVSRDRGAGRPTKKERRDMEDFQAAGLAGYDGLEDFDGED